MNVPENAYHMNTHVHWACACWCAQEALGCELQTELGYKIEAAMMESKMQI